MYTRMSDAQLIPCAPCATNLFDVLRVA